MKLFRLFMLALSVIAGGWQTSALAAPGWCTRSAPYVFSPVFDKIFTSTDNATGNEFKDVYKWNLGGGYTVVCECGGTSTQTHFKTTIPLSFSQQISTLNYYTLNEYLDIATKLWIDGNLNKYVPTPFDDQVNSLTTKKCNSNESFGTGSAGQLSVYIKKSFVGKLTIPPTKILSVFGTRTTNSYSPDLPISEVYLTATFTVPQSCNINAGQVINVDFGNIKSSDILSKGALPTGFIKKNIKVDLACTNIAEGVEMELSLQGTPDASEPTMLATTNTDVGVRLEDTAGVAITPGTGRLPVTMDYATQKGTSEFNAYPSNSTGNKPKSGAFTATTTIRAELK